MTAAKTFEDLIVWQKAHALVLDVYRLTKSFPKEEIFGLTSQLRRAVVSVTSNIVEGFNREGKADKLKFYNYADASLEETRYQLRLSHDLKYGDTTRLQEQSKEVRRILSSYTSTIKNS
ncbi:MAG: four helix bundle protein [Verrucomicrobiales bacterium]